MQADAEARMPLRDACGLGGVRLVHHEAGLREDARFVIALNGFVDAGAAAKVVAGEDESFQNTDRAGTFAREPDVFAILPDSKQGMNWCLPILQIGLSVVCVAGLVYALLAAVCVDDWQSGELPDAELPPLTSEPSPVRMVRSLP